MAMTCPICGHDNPHDLANDWVDGGCWEEDCTCERRAYLYALEREARIQELENQLRVRRERQFDLFSSEREPRGPIVHDLKCWPDFFEAVISGRKRFEWRFADRDYREGDFLHLSEWNPATADYTGREASFQVTYLMPLAQLPEYVILSIAEREARIAELTAEVGKK